MEKLRREFSDQKIIDILNDKSLQTSDIASKLKLERHTTIKYLESLEGKGLIKHDVKRRSKIWSIVDSPVIDMLRKNDVFSRQLTELLDGVDEHISIKDKKFDIIWKNQHAKGLKGKELSCHETHFNQKQRCKNCPVEKTFITGKSESLQIASDGRTRQILTKPIKDNNNQTIAVVEIIKERR
ncbi:MAG: helix-turn-helix domain-containing protein [Candidatus Woesearchaeota archaeon]|jgi:Mn-dependent DtxR family transcriptional regulator